MVDRVNPTRPAPQPAPAPAPAPQPAAAPAQGQPRQAGDRRAVSPEARAKAPKDPYEALLAIKGKDDGGPEPRRVGLTPFSTSSASWSSQAAKAGAAKELEANRGKEQEALAKLGPRAAEYNRVRDLIKNDPTAERALQKMLLGDDQKLMTRDLDGGKDLLGHLNDIATQKNAHGVHADELLRTFTRELENPEAMSQGDGSIGTCVATSVTIAAAKNNPAEVARLVAGLAKESPGEVRMHPGPGETEGPVLKRPDNWNVDTKGKDGDASGVRTPSIRLLQPALMNEAMNQRLREKGLDPAKYPLKYDPRTDAFTPSGGSDTSKNGGHPIKQWEDLNDGLDSGQANHLLQHMTNRTYTAEKGLKGEARQNALDRIARSVGEIGSGKGVPVPIGVNYVDGTDKGGHEMLVVGASGVRPNRRFEVVDPIKGGKHFYTEAQLRGAMDEANIPN